MRPCIGTLFAALVIALGCAEGLPSEEVPLDGSWHDEYGYDTSSWGWRFERHANGVTYGGWHSHTDPTSTESTQIDTAWVTYPEILVRMVMDSVGNCWPGGTIGRCTISGRFLSRNRIEIGGMRFERSNTR